VLDVMDGYLEASSDGCTFATASPRTPAYYRDGVRHELDGGVDIVAISPDGLAGIIYQDEGWYALIDLVDPDSPATRLLPDADQDLTFAFVAAD
jgi:hypothetical protein